MDVENEGQDHVLSTQRFLLVLLYTPRTLMPERKKREICEASLENFRKFRFSTFYNSSTSIERRYEVIWLL